MTALKQITVLTALILALLPAPGARADYVLNFGALTCDSDRALIRFTVAYPGEPLIFPDPPPEIDHGLSELPRIDGNTCTLSDGREVKVKLGERQGMAWGACGAANDGFMSLWVGGRKVISWHQVTNACHGTGPGNAIVLDDRRLSLCATETASAGSRTTGVEVTCKDATALLEEAQPDPVEYPSDRATQPSPGSMNLLFAKDATLCSRFATIEPGRYTPETEAFAQASVPDAFFAPGSMQSTPPPRYRQGPQPPFAVVRFAFPNSGASIPEFKNLTQGISWSVAHFDFDNHGERDLVLRQSGRSGGFYGDILYLPKNSDRATLETAIESFLARTKKPLIKEVWDYLSQFEFSEYTWPFQSFASQYPKTYTLQNTFRMNGETLIFASAVWRKTRPTAVIYRPTTGGAAEPVCIFQRVEENF